MSRIKAADAGDVVLELEGDAVNFDVEPDSMLAASSSTR